MTTAAWPADQPEGRASQPLDNLGTGRLGLGARGPHGSSLPFHDHLSLHGPLPDLGGGEVRSAIERSGLTGRGGAAFPVHRKMSAVAAGAGPRVVVANAAEGEPASAKDKTLVSVNPHLTLDGLQLAARAVGADHAYFYAHDDGEVPDVVRRALLERRRQGADDVMVEV